MLPQQVVWLMFRLVVLTLIAATALCCVVGQSMILFLTSNGQEVATTGFYKFAAKTNWKLAFEFFVCFSEHCIGGRNKTNLVCFVSWRVFKFSDVCLKHMSTYMQIVIVALMMTMLTG